MKVPKFHDTPVACSDRIISVFLIGEPQYYAALLNQHNLAPSFSCKDIFNSVQYINTVHKPVSSINCPSHHVEIITTNTNYKTDHHLLWWIKAGHHKLTISQTMMDAFTLISSQLQAKLLSIPWNLHKMSRILGTMTDYINGVKWFDNLQLMRVNVYVSVVHRDYFCCTEIILNGILFEGYRYLEIRKVLHIN